MWFHHCPPVTITVHHLQQLLFDKASRLAALGQQQPLGVWPFDAARPGMASMGVERSRATCVAQAVACTGVISTASPWEKALTRHHEQGIMNLQPTACKSVSKQSNKLSHSLFQSPATHRGWCIVRLTDVPRPEATPSPANSRSPRQRLALERSGPNDDGCLVTQVPFPPAMHDSIPFPPIKL